MEINPIEKQTEMESTVGLQDEVSETDTSLKDEPSLLEDETGRIAVANAYRNRSRPGACIAPESGLGRGHDHWRTFSYFHGNT